MCDFEFETREILIACVGDGWRKVEARVCGDFAYHRKRRGFSVTHVPSGLGCSPNSTLTEAEAEALCRVYLGLKVDGGKALGPQLREAFFEFERGRSRPAETF